MTAKTPADADQSDAPLEPLAYSIRQAAELLGVSYFWLRDAVTARRVPHTRLGKHVRFTREHIAQILAAGEEPVVSTRTTYTQMRHASSRRSA